MNLDPFSKNGLGSQGSNGNSKSSAEKVFVKSKNGGAGRRTAPTEPMEPMDIPEVQEEPVEEKKAEPEAVLTEGAWNKSETLFQEETEVSVKLALPKGKEHLTRIEAELHVRTPKGPELISRSEGHAKADGTAVFTLPVYKPNGHQSDPVDYFLVFKHKIAKVFKPESLLRKVSDIALKSADHVLIPGICFAKNSSFIRPKFVSGLKALESRVKDWESKHPKGKIVIYGHADSDESEPNALSERRAESVFAFITNDSATWDKLYKSEKWGLIALQHLMLDCGDYKGKPDNEDGPATQSAFRAVQNRSGLPESGKEDSATRKALFSAYMKGKHDIKLNADRFRKVAGNSWMGCSTLNKAKEGDKPAPENRRVAFILINESKFFPVHFPCQDGKESACQSQCKKPGKRSVPGNKCAFYDELLREEKQEQPEIEREKIHNVSWMNHAESEAKRWKGAREADISKSINYHKEVGINLKDLVGTDHAWCASFVNYCLKKAGYEMSSPPCRARSFLDDPNFVKIEKPIFGAIAVIATHHVCFVFADDSKSAKPVVLGGNQSDQINFTVFHEKISYFLPKTFDPLKHDVPALASKTAAEMNTEFGIVKHAKSGDSTR